MAISPLLESVHRERYHNDYVPADHTDVKQVHHPQAPADSQHQEHSNHLAEHNTAHAAEVDGQTRNDRIYFKPSHANYGQRRQTYFPEGWHGAEPNRPFVRTKGLIGFVSQISSSPGYIDADRRWNRFPVPAPLQPF